MSPKILIVHYLKAVLPSLVYVAIKKREDENIVPSVAL